MKLSDRECIRQKYNNHCAYCGCILEKVFHVDHLEPIIREEGRYEVLEDGNRHFIPSIGGMRYPDRDVVDNYMPSCPSCNIIKGQNSLEDFRSMIYNFIHSLNIRDTRYKFVKKYGLVIETNTPIKFYFERVV